MKGPFPSTYQRAAEETEGPCRSDVVSHVPVSRRQDVALTVPSLLGRSGCWRSQATPLAEPGVGNLDMGFALLFQPSLPASWGAAYLHTRG